MIDIAGLVVLVEEETEVDSPRNNLFVDVVDLNTFEQQPTTSQESGESTNYKELLSNYTNDSNIFGSIHFPTITMNVDNKLTTKFPAYKWECTLPENVVDKQNRLCTHSMTNGSQRSPTYSLNFSSNSSPLSIRPLPSTTTKSSMRNSSTDSMVENESIQKFDLNFESFAFAEIVSIFDTLIRDSQLDSQQPIDQVEFEYTFLDGTIMRLKTRDFTSSNNPNPLFCRIKTHPLQNLMMMREQILIELGKLLNESIDKENCPNWPLRSEHKLSKRLSNSIRKARRLSSYGIRKEIFGRSLGSIKSSSNVHSPFPLFVHQMFAILLHEARLNNIEGLLRTSASKNKLDEAYKLCSVLSVNDSLPMELCNSHNVFILADLLKRFLREIPGSLLSQHAWQFMIRCFKLDGKDRLLGLQYCVLLLNSSQREALFTLGAFFLKLSHYQHNTLMDIKNIVTVILPNIIEIGPMDPLEQSSKCKTLVGPLTFIFEHIFDVMCLPIKLLYNIDKFGHKKSNFQIALNAYTFNVNYSLLQKNDVYWRNESVDMNGIVVKSKIDYNDLDKKSLELWAEIFIPTNSNAVFAQLIVNDDFWDSIFVDYKHHSLCEDETEIIECKTRYCEPSDEPLYLKRYNGRIYDQETQAQIYVLYHKQIQEVENVSNIKINQLSFLVYPIDVYNCKVIFLFSIACINKPQNSEYSPKGAALVLGQFRDLFESNTNH